MTKCQKRLGVGRAVEKRLELFRLGHSSFLFRICLGFRYSDFGFWARKHPRCALFLVNPKLEARNPKQIQMTKFQMSKTPWGRPCRRERLELIRLGHSSFLFWICLGFRYSDFGFWTCKMINLFLRGPLQPGVQSAAAGPVVLSGVRGRKK